jgi:hypothetical protein
VSECLVDGCGRPVTDADVCSDCARRCSIALGEVTWLMHELDLVITRQTAKAERVGGASADQPLVFSWAASDLRWALENTITTWARVVADEKPADLPLPDPRPAGPYCRDCAHHSCASLRRPRPAPHLGIIAGWLAIHIEWLRHHPAAVEAVDEITACIHQARRAVDVRPARLYAGPCTAKDAMGRECKADLYADPSSAVVTCPACLTRYDVAERKKWLMETARDHLASASEASRLCWTMRGDLVTTAMIRGYVRRGKLASHASRNESGREVALYRIGDVLDASDAVRWDAGEQQKTRRAGAA